MSFDFNNPLLYELRAGTIDDPYVNKSDHCLIVNNNIILSEIPDEFEHVTINGYTEVYYIEDLSSDKFFVNYLNGIITFASSENGKSVTANYKGRGIIQIPAERVYVTDGNGNLISSFQQYAIDITTESTRVSNESTRVSNENTRISNENTRKNNEITRQTNENTRNSQENSRTNAESSRVTVEGARVSAESGRVSAENSRVNAENGRVSAESTRQAGYTSSVLIWQAPVSSQSNIASTYPSPSVGWTTTALDTGNHWRYNGSSWINIGNLAKVGMTVGSSVPSDTSLIFIDLTT